MNKGDLVSGYCKYCNSGVLLQRKDIVLENKQVITIYDGICPECGKEIEEELL